MDANKLRRDFFSLCELPNCNAEPKAAESDSSPALWRLGKVNFRKKL